MIPVTVLAGNVPSSVSWSLFVVLEMHSVTKDRAAVIVFLFVVLLIVTLVAGTAPALLVAPIVVGVVIVVEAVYFSPFSGRASLKSPPLNFHLTFDLILFESRQCSSFRRLFHFDHSFRALAPGFFCRLEVFWPYLLLGPSCGLVFFVDAFSAALSSFSSSSSTSMASSSLIFALLPIDQSIVFCVTNLFPKICREGNHDCVQFLHGGDNHIFVVVMSFIIHFFFVVSYFHN